MGTWLRVAACFAVLMCVPVASAAAAEVTATISVSGGPMSISADNVVLVPDGSTVGAYSQTSHWTATDARGTGGGWHLTISVDMITADGLAIGDQALEIQLLDGSVDVVAGNARPSSLVASPTPVPGTGSGSLRFLSAEAHQGMGTYDLHPEFNLTTPAGSSATSYSATLTVDIATGP
ncbi:MAG: WxL domain-containing protein [Acidimicrobiia bacterium]|nr:WxL domain-containing protein [Actinomycetota bacterium]MBL6926055.1 WxL domain-containing protein [Acidimicrobiia bacterium]